MKRIKIALLYGGRSGEREVSLKTGKEIYNALNKNKYEIFRYDPKKDLKRFFLNALSKKFDLVFPALHGPYGEDGRLQGMLDMIDMPFLFSGALASALAINKHKTKIIANYAGLNVVPDIIIIKNEDYNLINIIKKLSLPIVIKPMELGSSVGMSIVKNKPELKRGISKAFKYSDSIMLEKFIKGRELTVTIMGNEPKIKALPVIEIIPKISDWFDYKAKYEIGGSDEICPANISANIKDKIQGYALKIYRAIGCKDLARADFIRERGNGKLYFLEINTIPGMTKASLVPKAAKADGLEFSEFLDELINQALKNN